MAAAVKTAESKQRKKSSENKVGAKRIKPNAKEQPEQKLPPSMTVTLCVCDAPVIARGYYACGRRTCPYCPHGDPVFACERALCFSGGRHCATCLHVVAEEGKITADPNAAHTFTHLPGVMLNCPGRLVFDRRTYPRASGVMDTPVSGFVDFLRLVPRTSEPPAAPYTCVVRGLYPFNIIGSFPLPLSEDKTGMHTVTFRDGMEALVNYLHSTPCPLPAAQSRMTEVMRELNDAVVVVARNKGRFCLSDYEEMQLEQRLARAKEAVSAAKEQCKVDAVTNLVVSTTMNLFDSQFKHGQGGWVTSIKFDGKDRVEVQIGTNSVDSLHPPRVSQ